jgi:hypothetical protein
MQHPVSGVCKATTKHTIIFKYLNEIAALTSSRLISEKNGSLLYY